MSYGTGDGTLTETGADGKGTTSASSFEGAADRNENALIGAGGLVLRGASSKSVVFSGDGIMKLNPESFVVSSVAGAGCGSSSCCKKENPLKAEMGGCSGTGVDADTDADAFRNENPLAGASFATEGSGFKNPKALTVVVPLVSSSPFNSNPPNIVGNVSFSSENKTRLPPK